MKPCTGNLCRIRIWDWNLKIQNGGQKFRSLVWWIYMKLGTIEFYGLMNNNLGYKFQNFGNFEKFMKLVILYETLYWIVVE